MKKIILSITFFLSFAGAYGHHLIQGMVIDAEKNTPLPGANIWFAQEGKGTISDEFGRFQLEIETTEATITISYVGYADQTLTLNEHDGQVRVLLQPSPTELAQLSISSGGMNSVNSISKLDLKIRPVNSSQEVLRIVPGLFIAQHAGGGKAEQIFLRGFDLDHGTDINITVDGIPVNMVSHAHGQGYADLHFLIPELINVVDFGKGPYYTDKGNLATAGYVGFSTKNSLNHNVVKLEGGRFNTMRMLGMFNLLDEKMALKGQNAIAAIEYNLTDGPFISPQNFNRINLFTKYTGYFENSQMLTLMFSKLSSKWDASGQIPQRAVNDGALPRFGAIDDTEGGNTARTNASIRLVSNLPSGLVADHQLYYSHYDFDLYSNFTFYLNNPIDGDQIRQKEQRDIIGFSGELSKSGIEGFKSLDVKIGYGFRYDDIKDVSLSNTKNRRQLLHRLALGDINETNGWMYAEASWELGRWMANAGARLDGFVFDYVDKLDSLYSTQSQQKMRVSPKLNIIYHFNERMRLYAKSGMGFHSNDTRVVVAAQGREVLPAAYGIDLGTTLKPAPSVYLNLAYWYLYMQQEFVYVGDEAVVEPGGKTRRHGADLSLRWQALPWLFADFDLNYAIPKALHVPDGENHIPLAPTLTSIGGLTFQSDMGLSGALRYRYIKDRPANENNSVVAIGYNVIDAKINYTGKYYELGISAENLFNTDWNEAQFAALTRLPHESAAVEDLTFTPGVPFFIKFSASFLF